MSKEIQNLEPKAVWGKFYEITQIPRPSKHEEKIMTAYNTQVRECHSIPFAHLFAVILDYLHYTKNVGNTNEQERTIIKSAFSFELCDQNNYREKLNN